MMFAAIACLLIAAVLIEIASALYKLADYIERRRRSEDV